MLCIDDIEFNQEILDKARGIIEKHNYEQVCFKAGICPQCGGSIFNEWYNSPSYLKRYWRCLSCEFKQILY
jgi:hypothetical protein